MLAHCSITYEMMYDDNHKKPNVLMGFMLRTFVKHIVVSEKPYKKNSRTAPAFMITDERNFETEKKRFIDYKRWAKLTLITKNHILSGN